MTQFKIKNKHIFLGVFLTAVIFCIWFGFSLYKKDKLLSEHAAEEFYDYSYYCPMAYLIDDSNTITEEKIDRALSRCWIITRYLKIAIFNSNPFLNKHKNKIKKDKIVEGYLKQHIKQTVEDEEYFNRLKIKNKEDINLLAEELLKNHDNRFNDLINTIGYEIKQIEMAKN